MNHLFNLDGPVLQFINKIVYSVYLNILWFICCIPVSIRNSCAISERLISTSRFRSCSIRG